MTLANRITIARILLIPVFVGLAVSYANGAAAGAPVEWRRWAAVTVFFLAAAGDGLDGWAARHYQQHSALGRILDPLADKLLLLAGIVTLSLSPWSHEHRLPLWFPAIVVARDVLCIGAAFLIKHVRGAVCIRPHWTGKVAIVAQIVALGWVMLQLTWLPALVPVAVAGFFTWISGVVYLHDGVGQMRR